LKYLLLQLADDIILIHRDHGRYRINYQDNKLGQGST